MPDFIAVKIKGFSLTVRNDLEFAWLEQLISNLEQLPPVPYAPNRYRGIIKAPVGFEFENLFAKSYSHTDCQHTSIRRTHFLHRLRPRYAYKEGLAYLNYAKNNIPAPAPIAFGEEWRLGIRNRGIIITEAIEAITVQDALNTDQRDYWIRLAFETIKQIHSAGLTHGDANLVNFLANENRIIAIDLENSREITHKKQLSDLVNVLKSCLLVSDQDSLLLESLSNYENSGLALPASKEDLIKMGRAKADKYRKQTP